MLDYTNSVIYHDGQKGMHWGVRKYRNYDGTLTPAGKARYDYSNGDGTTPKKTTRADRKIAKAKEKEKKARQAERDAKKAAEELKKRQAEFAEEQKNAAKERLEIQKLTNDELKAKIERLNLERQYDQLINPQIPVQKIEKKSKTEKVKKFLGEVAGAAGYAKTIYDAYHNIDKMRHPEKYEKQDPLKALKAQEEKERLKASIDKSKFEMETRNRTRSDRAEKDAQKSARESAERTKASAWASSWASSWADTYSGRYGSSSESVKNGSSFVNNSKLLTLPASSSYLALPPGNPFAPPQSYYNNKR